MTDGQRCLLEILQSKLWNTILTYAKLSREKLDSNKSELIRLKERIRRISGRQKKFTLEIIKRNGNTSISKEAFFEALGLVTKEALSKLNSKSSQRRRRTTANPRFSHEAIQAKRALEPGNKRENTRRPARPKDRELFVQYESLHNQITSKVSSINHKRESNKRLEKQNELIMSAINMINQSTEGSSWIDMQCDEIMDGLD